MNNFLFKNLFFTLFSASFALMYLGGTLASDLLNTLGYYKTFNPVALLQASIYYLIFIISFIALKKIKSFYQSPPLHYKPSRALYIFPLTISIVSIFLYFSKNGLVLLGAESYESRYTANFGLGAFTLGMQLYYLYIAGLIFYKKDIPTKSLLIVSIGFAILTFLLLGGHRQLGLGVIIGILTYLVLEKKINANIFWLAVIVFIPISLGSAILRYDYHNISISEIIISILIFFYDGITPINAHSEILNFTSYYGSPGSTIAFQQFASYIPRFIWSDKPEILMNGGNYYTSMILGRSSLVTYSPTLIGELLLVHGNYFYLTAPFLAGIIIKLDAIVRSRSFLGLVLIMFAFTLCFNLYREGLYVFLSKIAVILLLTQVVVIFSRLRINIKRA